MPGRSQALGGEVAMERYSRGVRGAAVSVVYAGDQIRSLLCSRQTLRPGMRLRAGSRPPRTLVAGA